MYGSSNKCMKQVFESSSRLVSLAGSTDRRGMDSWGRVLVFEGDESDAAALCGILEANGIATEFKGTCLYVMQTDEAEARLVIASAQSADRPVDRDVAEEIVYRLTELQQTLSRPLRAPAADEVPGFVDVRRIIGDTIGIIYTDLMNPFIEQYPDLDPDRGGLQVPSDRPAEPSGPIDEAQFAKASRDAAVAAIRDLDALGRFVESREGARAR